MGGAAGAGHRAPVAARRPLQERPGFNGGPKTRVVLAGALKLKDVLGLEFEWSKKKLSRGDGMRTPHLQ